MMQAETPVEAPVAPRWVNRRQVEQMLREAGMACSRATVERLVADADETGFPLPRQIHASARRIWERELVVAWIARSRCSAPTAADEAPEVAA